MHKRLYNLLLWCSTECSEEMSWSRNKHYGQRYWSKKALELFIKNKGETKNIDLTVVKLNLLGQLLGGAFKI